MHGGFFVVSETGDRFDASRSRCSRSRPMRAAATLAGASACCAGRSADPPPSFFPASRTSLRHDSPSTDVILFFESAGLLSNGSATSAGLPAVVGLLIAAAAAVTLVQRYMGLPKVVATRWWAQWSAWPVRRRHPGLLAGARDLLELDVAIDAAGRGGRRNAGLVRT